MGSKGHLGAMVLVKDSVLMESVIWVIGGEIVVETSFGNSALVLHLPLIWLYRKAI